MGRNKAEPHPNSIAANLGKLPEEVRKRYDKNRRDAADDAAAMESWARRVTGKGKFTGLSQDPLANDHTGPPPRRRAVKSKDRSDQ